MVSSVAGGSVGGASVVVDSIVVSDGTADELFCSLISPAVVMLTSLGLFFSAAEESAPEHAVNKYAVEITNTAHFFPTIVVAFPPFKSTIAWTNRSNYLLLEDKAKVFGERLADWCREDGLSIWLKV